MKNVLRQFKKSIQRNKWKKVLKKDQNYKNADEVKCDTNNQTHVTSMLYLQKTELEQNLTDLMEKDTELFEKAIKT